MTKRKRGPIDRGTTPRLVREQLIPACPDIVQEACLAFGFYLGIWLALMAATIALFRGLRSLGELIWASA